MTPEELEIAKAACCVGTIWDEYEGKENFDHMVGLRVKHLIELVRYYYQSSLSSNLDEAAENYTNDSLNNLGAILRVNVSNAFKAGAGWMAVQGYVDEVKYSDLEDRKYVFVPYEEFTPGDKVIVQIRKK